MSDQADTLRKLMRERRILEGRQPLASHTPPPQMITVSSGKGGVGKTCLVAMLGTMLARMGCRTLLVDGDTGLANLDIVMGVQPRVTLEQVLSGEARLQEAVLGLEPNLWLIPAATGLINVRQSDLPIRRRFLSLWEKLPWEMDVILVDAGAGIQSNVLSLHHPSFETLVVTTPQPTALTDAYGLLKILRRQLGIERAQVVVNQVTDGKNGQKAFQRLKDVAVKFSSVELDYLGHCPTDEKIAESVFRRKILLDWDPGAVSIAPLQLVAKRLQARCEARRIRAPRLREAAWETASFPNGAELGAATRTREGNTTGFWTTLLGEVNA